MTTELLKIYGREFIYDARYLLTKHEESLINDMNIYNMKIEQFQVNTKFLNSLPPRKDFLKSPSTNNQLRTSSNPRNQATIQDGRVIVQQVQGRQGQSISGTGYKSNVTSSRGNNASGQARAVKCYNCQGEGHMARQCTQPKRPRNATRIFGLNNDSDCDDISNAQAVLMANISNYGSDVISEVPHSETYLNDMENQSVHAMQDFEQTPAVDFTDNEIHSDSNIISYSQYLQETQQANVQDTNLQAQQDSMILSVIKQMSKQMINHVNN
ncbi:putative ribonuclease H-like domain-containing protein [Tanacetum coccineum]